MQNKIAILLLAVCGLAFNVAGPENTDGRISSTPVAATTKEPVDIAYTPPADIRALFYNHGNTGDRSGDCVQVSQGIIGVRNSDPKLTTLAWDSEYGPAIRGGSWPSRVSQYARERGIRIYNVTGSSIRDTYPWAQYAVTTGRGAAIGFDPYHFQSLMGGNPTNAKWLVCDNNSPRKIDEYTDAEFIAGHRASGYWIIVPDGPAPPPPVTEFVSVPKKKTLFQTLFGGSQK